MMAPLGRESRSPEDVVLRGGEEGLLDSAVGRKSVWSPGLDMTELRLELRALGRSGLAPREETLESRCWRDGCWDWFSLSWSGGGGLMTAPVEGIL